MSEGSLRNAAVRTGFAGACIALTVYFLALLVSGAAWFDKSRVAAVLAGSSFWNSLWLSFWTATVATALAVVVALPVAHFLSRQRFAGRAALDTLLDLPTLLSPIATGTLLLMLCHTEIGRRLQQWGVPVVYTKAGIVLAQFTIIVSLAVRLLKAAFDGIPRRYEDLARILGCDRWKAFWNVSMPLARPGMIAAVIICWARAFGEFGATVTLAGAMPGVTDTIPVAIYLRLGTADLEGALVLIAVLVAVSMTVLFGVRLLAGNGGARP